MCTDLFCPNEISESSQPERDCQRIVILSSLSSVMGDKGQPVTVSVDEIAVWNYLKPYHHPYPILYFFINIYLYLCQKEFEGANYMSWSM